MVKLAEGRIVEVPTTVENDFKISPQQLREALSPRSRLMIFSSPCNPSGTVYTLSELEALAQVIAEHEQLLVISDEIYEHINFTGSHASLAAIPGMAERVITVNGLSKGFAMTGWRLGYLGAPTWIAKACARMQGQYTSGTSSVTQRAAIAALQGDLEPTHRMREAFEKRRELVYRGLSTIEGIKFNRPEGAFYFFPDIRAFFGKKSPGGRTVDNPDDMANYLLEEAHLSMVSGTAFGDPNCIRLSYATNEATLNKAIDRLSAALSALS
jgi:aspartate aminotransferase